MVRPTSDHSPKAVVDDQWRAAALKDLERSWEESSAPNQDLTEDDAIALADQIAHELIDDMAERGDLVFERDLQKR